MKSGVVIIVAGVIMISCGLVMFYAVQSSPQIEPFFRTIKHAGTFIGLLGMGVTLAGVLLYLINRNQPQIQDFDVRE
jgi:NADH:ubiquinone oxidoreductase subunit 6 (subunit J)